MHSLFYLILSLIGLGVLIFFHELGHYIVARRVGMKVEVFAIGFGKPMLSWMHKGVKWQIGWIPFGGYVRIKGMEKEGNKEPHEIPDGYFGKNQRLNRIKVALAGPLVNFALAFLFFVIIWAFGGRARPFAESTQLVGYVSPKSALYEAGLRPGDKITTCNGRPYRSYSSLIEAAAISSDGVEVEGIHYNAKTGEGEPFRRHLNIKVDPDNLQSSLRMGLVTPASYLFVEKLKSHMPQSFTGAPLHSSGIQPGDRLLWVDGNIVYSPHQLQSILQEGRAFITVERLGKTETLSVKRVAIHDFFLSHDQQSELEDWHYANSSEESLFSMRFIPYDISPDGVVKGDLSFIDPDEKGQHNKGEHRGLEVGDRIVAIDGIAMGRGSTIFQALQSHKFSIITERNPAIHKIISEKKQDTDFEKDLDRASINKIANSIGTRSPVKQAGDLFLLPPIEPRPMHTYAKTPEEVEAFAQYVKKGRAHASENTNPDKKAAHLQMLEQQLNTPMLGLVFSDRLVQYNPLPWVAFGDVFGDIWRTLKALITGPLSPKLLSGPIGIVQVMQGGFASGMSEGLFWLAVISVNLGILNLMPIPVLDGGHICFAIWELVTGKTITAKTMQRLTLPFAILLIAFIIWITLQDLGRLLGVIFRG